MDIKLKNKYSAGIALLLCIYLLALSYMIIFDVASHENYLGQNPYFNSSTFKNELRHYFEQIKASHIDHQNFRQLPDEEKVTMDEITEQKEQLEAKLWEKEQEILSTYGMYINEAENMGNKDRAQLLTEERDAQLKEYREKTIKTTDEIRESILLDKTKHYEELKKSLSNKNDPIKYYIQDSERGEIYSNLDDVKDIEQYVREHSLYSLKLPQANFRDPYLGWVNNSFQELRWSGYFIVPLQIEGYSQLHVNYRYYNEIRERLFIEIFLLILVTGLAIFLFIQMKKKNLLDLTYVDQIGRFYRKVPLDIRAFILFVYSLGMIGYAVEISFFNSPFRLSHILKITFTAVYILYLIVNIREIQWMKKYKGELKNQWHSSILHRIKRLLSESFVNRSIFFKVILVLLLTALLGPFAVIGLMGLSGHNGFFLLISLGYAGIYLFMVFPYILKNLAFLNRILKGTDEMVSGNLNYVIEEKGNGALAQLARNINNIKLGLKASVENQMKSERLKSELITNVSHDLKTPLTSIINYVDLLKNEELPREEIQNYVQILDRKSQRLKVLIDDLFEASKMASGAVELNMEKVDVVALLNQALAEYDEKIQQSTLTFKVNIEKQKIFVQLDGKKTWRVFDNLISNALKYSQPNTRVYVSLSEEANKTVFTIKNISAYEMDFDVDEIFERFKRGDTSRNTEGSGLGLAIAKSIVDLQGGQLDIQVDGDLFKAIVTFYK